MNPFKVIGKVLKEPTTFFKNVGSGENHLGFAFGYYALLSFFYMILAILGIILFSKLFTVLSPGEFGAMAGLFYALVIPYMIVFVIVGYILGLGLTFVSAGLLYIWIKIFGGKNTYVKTYELGVYMGTPTFLFGWIPVVGTIVGSVWSFVLLIIGTQHVHDISKLKAVLMYLIPAAIFLILYLFLVLS